MDALGGVLFMMGFSMTCETGDGNEAIKKM